MSRCSTSHFRVQLRRGARQSMPSSSIDNCAAVSTTDPSFACGHKNRPRSSRLANRHNLAVPPQHLDQIAAATTEHEQRAAMRVEAKVVDPRRQPVKAFPHVGDAARQIDADIAGMPITTAPTRPGAMPPRRPRGQAQLHPRGQLHLDDPVRRPIGFGQYRHRINRRSGPWKLLDGGAIHARKPGQLAGTELPAPGAKLAALIASSRQTSEGEDPGATLCAISEASLRGQRRRRSGPVRTSPRTWRALV